MAENELHQRLDDHLLDNLPRGAFDVPALVAGFFFLAWLLIAIGLEFTDDCVRMTPANGARFTLRHH